MKIDVTATEREVFIRFNGVTHFRIDRRELVGLQSWKVNRGRIVPTSVIQIYTRSSAQEVLLEYDQEDKWIDVLHQLDEVPFLNEFKVQDP